MTDFTDQEEIKKALSKRKNLVNELKKDILILVGRLYLEDESTFAPETSIVMKKWKPIFERKHLKMEEKSNVNNCSIISNWSWRIG